METLITCQEVLTEILLRSFIYISIMIFFLRLIFNARHGGKIPSSTDISLPWRGSLPGVNLRKENFRIAMDLDRILRLDFL